MQEIWKCILGRLIELNVLADPDADSFGSDDNSTDLDDDFDFAR